MNPADHLKAAEDYLDLIEGAIVKAGKGTVPTSVLADAGLLHAHLAVAKLTEEARRPETRMIAPDFRGDGRRRQHSGRR